MKTHQREILIYYNPSSSTGRKTIAYAQGAGLHVKSYAFSRSPSNGTSWKQILQALDVHPRELMNKAHPYYQQHIRGRDFDDESWIKVIQHNPDLIKSPIAVRGQKAILCQTPTDIYKLANQFKTSKA